MKIMGANVRLFYIYVKYLYMKIYLISERNTKPVSATKLII
ncbi:hypothetical protein VIBNIENn2_740052 [Vibrio nigripulchritudo ENn2]|nr:hypothetical protein VIBNIENn2_740052 [Vibrio nigripulchritudo ENn2]